MMKKENKIALIAFPLGFGLFWLLNRFVLAPTQVPGGRAPSSNISDDDLQTAVSAYEEALMNQEDPTTLHQLNDEFADQFNIQIHQRQSDGCLVVSDMAGNTIATYDPTGANLDTNNIVSQTS